MTHKENKSKITDFIENNQKFIQQNIENGINAQNKSAKQLFEECGYNLDIETNEKEIIYCKDILNEIGYVNSIILTFELQYETLYIDNINYFNVSELQAINKQIEELGWV